MVAGSRSAEGRSAKSGWSSPRVVAANIWSQRSSYSGKVRRPAAKCAPNVFIALLRSASLIRTCSLLIVLRIVNGGLKC